MSRHGAQKRRKELARQEKQRAKEAARAQRKLERHAGETGGTCKPGEVQGPTVAELPSPPPQDP